MKNYTITVNGVAYDVTVEENGQGTAPAAPVRPAAAPKAAAGAGSIKIEAGAAGKVFKIERKVGDSVKKGDAVIIVEAMKMEIPMVAPSDGTVASIDCSVGDPVEAGTVLATLN
jgi:biotin carboxyl carrier protein